LGLDGGNLAGLLVYREGLTGEAVGDGVAPDGDEVGVRGVADVAEDRLTRVAGAGELLALIATEGVVPVEVADLAGILPGEEGHLKRSRRVDEKPPVDLRFLEGVEVDAAEEVQVGGELRVGRREVVQVGRVRSLVEVDAGGLQVELGNGELIESASHVDRIAVHVGEDDVHSTTTSVRVRGDGAEFEILDSHVREVGHCQERDAQRMHVPLLGDLLDFMGVGGEEDLDVGVEVGVVHLAETAEFICHVADLENVADAHALAGEHL